MIIASKYYCETQDIVVNIDVCRLLEIRGGVPTSNSPARSYAEGTDLLMKMEHTVLELIDFRLFVSVQEFNETQSIFNTKIKAQKL